MKADLNHLLDWKQLGTLRFDRDLRVVAVDKNAESILKVAGQSATDHQLLSILPEFVGNELLPFSPDIIVENGGDIYLKSTAKRIVGIYAGNSPLSGKIGLEINSVETPLGICTSSGTVGHSLSYGKADAVIVLSKSAAIADAAATAIGNLINQSTDINNGIELAKGIKGINGVVIIKDDDIGLWGKVRIRRTSI